MRTRIYCYADDIAIAAHHIFTVLPYIARALEAWRLASGLLLKGRKCAIVPVWPPPNTEAHELVDSISCLTGDVIATSARYLGVDIGPSCSNTQWSTVADEIHRRARDIRSASAALTKVALFNIHIGA